MEITFPYVLRGGGAQLALLSFGGSLSAGEVFEAFSAEVEKVKDVLYPHPDAARLIVEDEWRRWHLFSAVVSATATVAKKQKELALLFGFRKRILRGWTRVEED